MRTLQADPIRDCFGKGGKVRVSFCSCVLVSVLGLVSIVFKVWKMCFTVTNIELYFI